VGAQVSVSVLGPLEVRRGTEVVPVDGLKRRQLLAVPTAAGGDVVSVDRLCEALWDSDPPESARASLQSHLSRLRQAVQPELTIESGPAGYRLDLQAVDVDAARFDRLVGDANGGDRVEALGEALGMWRGVAFGEFAELPGVRGEALRLEESRLRATEDWIEARLEAGVGTEVVGRLEALVVDHPLRERFWRQLMVALHRSGRQADALRRCDALRTMLRDDLGLSLSSAAQQLEARILADDPTLQPAIDRTPSRPRPTLPVRDPTSLIGRDADVTEVFEALCRRRVVTICGPGGVGKTRLAMLWPPTVANGR
jgi:DNA-binding SARP family transcriptional activator